ncbi:BQ2448_1113 [Microbotryum intermedium]|uniref:BQ2448_1113 protein n=1 Tax=Microbotryum intermedium TaxID=269621 RepID=A0A238FAC7_9BASI|nr:BQ2448_1113 [Microbotryum intermedium]
MLVLHLIDPLQRIPSTTDVAPQQKSWVDRALSVSPTSSLKGIGPSALFLPEDVLIRILDFTEEYVRDFRGGEIEHCRDSMMMTERKPVVLDAHSRLVFQCVLYPVHD